MLGLRVHSFHDATLVALQWQHVAFDALGLQYVLEAWSSILWGRPDDIPTPHGGQEGRDGGDPFSATLAQGLAPLTGEQHVLADGRVGIAGIARWWLGYGMLWSAFRRRVGDRNWNGPWWSCAQRLSKRGKIRKRCS